MITTVAGGGFGGDNGPASSAGVAQPSGVAADSAGNLYIAEPPTGRIRKISNGVISTVAGNGTKGFGGDGGPAPSAELSPLGLAVDTTANIYVTDGSDRIRVLTPSVLPSINTKGVVPVFSSVPFIQAGSWVSLYGTNLSGATFVWSGDFPTSLGGVSVTVNGNPAYLWLVSPIQINLQAPDDTTTGLVSVVVNTPGGTAASTVTLAPYGPSFSLLGDGKHVAGVIATPKGNGLYGGGTYDLVGPSGAFSFNTRPVKPGEVLVLYGVGFGPTTPSVPAGQVFAGAASTTKPGTITIGRVNADVAFAGITEAGLYQINVTVPVGSGKETSCFKPR